MAEIIRKRRPIVASLLSIPVTGLGQLYNGRPGFAAVLFGLDFLPGLFIVAFSGLFLNFIRFIDDILRNCRIAVPAII